MPEGDTIYRAARTLHQALAGRTVTGFESVFPRLTRVDEDRPLRGRTIERVESRGKHLLVFFSGDLILRTHMRMHGSWHIYRPGERWQRPGHAMRLIIRTESFEAVGFDLPVAEFENAASLAKDSPLTRLGPDVLSPDFDRNEAVARIQRRPAKEIADALIDQSALAGIGNVYKSEVLFAGRVNPFTPVEQLGREQIAMLVDIAVTFMRANTSPESLGSMVTYTGLRRTTRRADPGERLWVYGRRDKPCRRCGTPISRQLQGPDARVTYWCERCQGRGEGSGGSGGSESSGGSEGSVAS